MVLIFKLAYSLESKLILGVKLGYFTILSEPILVILRSPLKYFLRLHTKNLLMVPMMPRSGWCGVGPKITLSLLNRVGQ